MAPGKSAYSSNGDAWSGELSMDWPDIGGWQWTVIGTMVGILIALASLVVSFRSHRASERSAGASEESAKAATESVDIQRRQWQESKAADFRILNTSVSYDNKSDDTPEILTVRVRNHGAGDAFGVEAWIKTRGVEKYRWSRDIGEIASHATSDISFECSALKPLPAPLHFKFCISYHDYQEHLLELTYCMISKGKRIPTLVAVHIDGTLHYDHPRDPQTEESREAAELLGLLPIPDDL